MREIITICLLLTGTSFSLLAGVGMVRMPDLFTRMQASTKSATLGVACILLAEAVYFGGLSVIIRSLLVVLFLFMTAPIAAHMISRAAYARQVPLWKNSVHDDLDGNYNNRTHISRAPAYLREQIDAIERDMPGQNKAGRERAKVWKKRT
jgi:multicomponent Na+:H+ antiporter subunit G